MKLLIIHRINFSQENLRCYMHEEQKGSIGKNWQYRFFCSDQICPIWPFTRPICNPYLSLNYNASNLSPKLSWMCVLISRGVVPLYSSHFSEPFNNIHHIIVPIIQEQTTVMLSCSSSVTDPVRCISIFIYNRYCFRKLIWNKNATKIQCCQILSSMMATSTWLG